MEANTPPTPPDVRPEQSPAQPDPIQPATGPAAASPTPPALSDKPDQAVGDALHQLAEDSRAYRQEVAQLRQELAARDTAATPATSVAIPTDEEKLQQRMEEIANASHYCPGCGRLYTYMRECEGSLTAPHPAIEVVSTDELTGGDSDKHTAAPASA